MINKILQDSEFQKYHSGERSSFFPRVIHQGGLKITLAFFLIFIFFLFLPWTQTIRGSGRVIAYSPNERVQWVDSPVNGFLGSWFVEEGSFVKQGDPIVALSDNDPDLLQRLRLQEEAIQKKGEAARVAVENSRFNFERLGSLLKKGIVSRRDFEKSKIEYNKFLAEEAKVKGELLAIETQIARQSAQEVRAPRDGYIQRRRAGTGSQLVKVGDPLAILVPETSSRSAEVFISGLDAPFVKPGQKVRIQFEGWPAIQSFGWPSLAKGTFGGIVNFIDRQLDVEGFSRALVTPDPDDEPWPESDILRQGGRVYAWVLLNQVSLGFELWRNFNGFPPIISQDDLYKKLETTAPDLNEDPLDSRKSFPGGASGNLKSGTKNN